MNVLITYSTYSINSTAEYYRGLYYNSTNDFLYVAAFTLTEIRVFNSDLELNDTILTAPYYPISINEHNNQLHVGSIDIMLVIVKKQIVKKLKAGDGSGYLHSILFDQFGNMATECLLELYLYNAHDSLINTILPASPPLFI